MAYTFDQIFAADPANPSNVAQNASITIFAPGDGTMTPLEITDPDGQPLTNPLTVNANGFGSAFAHATLDRVAWAGGSFTGFFTSYDGMKNEAVAARTAAETAAADATDVVTRANAGEFIGATGPQGLTGANGTDGLDGSNVLPTSEAIEQALVTPGPARTALDAAFADTVNSRVGAEIRLNSVERFALGDMTQTTWVTPDGTGVVVHPSVRYFPNGFNGYRWWAAATPYFNSNNQVENPCIFVSDNGINWAPPPGVTNPLFPVQPAGYNSDTHLIQGPDGKLYLFFRDYSSSGTAAEKIRLMESADGITWSAAVQIAGWADNVKRLMSPAIWWDADAAKWVMIGVEILAQPRIVQRFTATDPYGPWTYTGNVSFDKAWPTGRSAWHIDAMALGTQVVMVIQDAVSNGSGGDIYLAVSSNGGTSFTRATNPIATGNHYRSCFLPRITEEGIALDMWIGDAGGSWGVKRGLATVPALTTERDLTLTMLAAKTGTVPYVLGDDFNRADNATGLGTAPSGQAWTNSLAILSILNKKATVPTATNSRAFIDAGTANYEMEAEFVTAGVTAHQGWLCVRAVDGSNYVRFGIDGTGLSIQRVTAGSVTVLHNFGSQSSPSRNLKIRCVGSTITVYRGSEVVVLTETQGQTSTQVGLQLNNTDMTFDNLRITGL